MIGELGLLGVPSSAAAHGPGQEKAPAALRRARLLERLAAAGARIVDYGDLPVVRWRPDPHHRRPHNLQAVLGVLRKTSARVGEILADGRVPLVLGGECTVTVAVLSAFLDRGIEPALLYMGGGVDLFTPATNPTGILTFDEAMTCLAVFARQEGLAGLAITEFNPDHGAEDGSTTDALVRGLVAALTG